MVDHEIHVTLIDSNGDAQAFWVEYHLGASTADDPNFVTPLVEPSEYDALCDLFGGESELLLRAHQAASEQYYDSTSCADVEALPSQCDDAWVEQ